MIQDGLLRLEETLGEIFADSEAWSASIASASASASTSQDTTKRKDQENNDDDLEFRKSITVKELLTMTSGLRYTKYPVTIDVDGKEHWNDGGGTLSEALLDPPVIVDIDAATKQPKQPKPFHYIGANNILSYIVSQRTVFASPLKYLEAKVFPWLGIRPKDRSTIEWQTNNEGMELSFYGLSMTTTHMAKLGQLYLQGGKSSATHSLVDSHWITTSTAPQSGNSNYGYLWWVYPPNTTTTTTTTNIAHAAALAPRNNNTHAMFCARGLGGQDVWVCPGTNRVLAQQRDFNFARKDNDAGSAMRLAECVLSSNNLVFV